MCKISFAGEHLLGLHTWGEGHRRKGSILARVCSDEREKDSGLNLVQKRFLSERALEILIFFLQKEECISYNAILFN